MFAVFDMTLLLVAIGGTSAAWSTCSKSCGGGNQWRESCAFFGICSTIYRGCNDHKCVSGWGQWMPCSKSCGGGTRFKVDRCSQNSLTLCPKTYGDCNTKACTPVSSCSSGYEYRYKDRSQCCKKSSETCGVVDSGQSLRVFGGKVAELGQWPWAAVLVVRISKTAECGGSLVHAQWILTAAHCIVNKNTVNYYILLGTTTIKVPSNPAQKREIEKFIPHTGYLKPLHDIGLIKLKTEATINIFVKPVCLPSGEIVKQDTTCFAAGWGISTELEWKVYQPSDVLKQAGLRVLPWDSCVVGLTNAGNTLIGRATQLQHICIGQFAGGLDTCTGDSGGPVVCQRCSTCGWYLAAITSFGDDNCGRTAGVPAVYMNMAMYEHWIRKYVNLSKANHFVC